MSPASQPAKGSLSSDGQNQQSNSSKILQDSSNTSISEKVALAEESLTGPIMSKSDSDNAESSIKYNEDSINFDCKSISKEASFDNKMDVDHFGPDIDSGIENMDVDNIDEKRENLKRQRDSSFELKANKPGDPLDAAQTLTSEILRLISKIFAVNFTVGQASYSGNSSTSIDFADSGFTATEDYKNTVQFILMEVVGGLLDDSRDYDASLQSFNQLLPEKFTSTIQMTSCPSSSSGASSKKKLDPDSLETDFLAYRNRYILAFAYILDSYKRVFTEESLSPEKCCEVASIRDLLTSIRNQCINYGSLLLLQANKSSGLNKFVLQLQYSGNFPCGFMSGLISSTYQSSGKEFKNIFAPLLHHLWLDMQTYCSLAYENLYKLPLEALNDLCQVAVGKSNFPIGELVSIGYPTMMVHLVNFNLLFIYRLPN